MHSFEIFVFGSCFRTLSVILVSEAFGWAVSLCCFVAAFEGLIVTLTRCSALMERNANAAMVIEVSALLDSFFFGGGGGWQCFCCFSSTIFLAFVYIILLLYSVQLQHSEDWHFECMLGSLGVSIIQWTARIGYATKETLFISARLSADAVGTLWKLCIRLPKKHSVKAWGVSAPVQIVFKKSVSNQMILILFVLA